MKLGQLRSQQAAEKLSAVSSRSPSPLVLSGSVRSLYWSLSTCACRRGSFVALNHGHDLHALRIARRCRVIVSSIEARLLEWQPTQGTEYIKLRLMQDFDPALCCKNVFQSAADGLVAELPSLLPFAGLLTEPAMVLDTISTRAGPCDWGGARPTRQQGACESA